MAVAYYSIRIISDQNNLNNVSKILNIVPKNNRLTWIYEVVCNDESPYYNFINEFLDILENKYEELSRIGVNKDDISFWFLYEYNNECNMEFIPSDMKRLGEAGITLCISCFKTGSYIEIPQIDI
ncbi:MAG: hypothetical protein WCR42_05465 [bacterium]